MGRFLTLLQILILASFVWISGVGSDQGSFAQAATTAISDQEYEDWDDVAARADAALQSEKASNDAFTELRNEIIDWRRKFEREKSRNRDSIKILEAQIAALGDPPEEEETEDADLAERRAVLDERLLTLNAPARSAEEAFILANGLILQVDKLLRKRQQTRLAQRNSSPFAPGSVGTAMSDVRAVVRILVAEVSTASHLKTEQVQLRQNLPTIAALIGLAIVLLLWGREWFQQIIEWLLKKRTRSESVVVIAMLVSVGQIALPMIGLISLVAALQLTSMLGPSGTALLSAVPSMGFFFFAARWLGGQIYPKSDEMPSVLQLSARQRVRGRFYSTALGVIVATAALLTEIFQFFVINPETVSVVAFPVIVLAALCLWGIGGLLMAHKPASAAREAAYSEGLSEVDERGLFDLTVGVFGRVCRALAVVGPPLALIGYTSLGAYFTVSPSLALGLTALVVFLQQLTGHLIRLFSRTGSDGDDDGLWTVLAKSVILVSALPIYAVIWGARWDDLTEIWNDLRAGISIGGVTISPMVVFSLLAVFLFGLLITRLVQGFMRTSILPRTRLDHGAQKAAVSGLGYIGITAAAMIAVSAAGLDLRNLAIVAGALSVGIGFGLQNVVSNFVSGLILLIERPVTEGDWIEVGGVMGTVKRISVRATTVETFDRTAVIVPNSDLVTNQVINWTRGSLTGRLILPVGVAYGTDTRRVAEILQQIAEEHPLVIVNPPPMVVFQGFGADSLDFEMRVILRDINFGLGARTELNHRIAERFAEEGIEVPFAQRDIWLRNPEALHSKTAQTPTPGIRSAAKILPDASPEFPSESDD